MQAILQRLIRHGASTVFLCARRYCGPCGGLCTLEREKPDIVVNFAAESHVDRLIENPEIFLQTNIIGTSVLLDACCKYGIKRYHQVSTDEVYGDLPLDRPDLLFYGGYTAPRIESALVRVR